MGGGGGVGGMAAWWLGMAADGNWTLVVAVAAAGPGLVAGAISRRAGEYSGEH